MSTSLYFIFISHVRLQGSLLRCRFRWHTHLLSPRPQESRQTGIQYAKQFVVYDINTERIKLCQENKPHIYEQGLVDVMHKTNGVNLSFTVNIH